MSVVLKALGRCGFTAEVARMEEHRQQFVALKAITFYFAFVRG
jgi:hypothetical protein